MIFLPRDPKSHRGLKRYVVWPHYSHALISHETVVISQLLMTGKEVRGGLTVLARPSGQPHQEAATLHPQGLTGPFPAGHRGKGLDKREMDACLVKLG